MPPWASGVQSLVVFGSLLLLVQPLDAAETKTTAEAVAKGCRITAAFCRNFPALSGSQFRDLVGEELFRAAIVPAACFKRAEDFHHWCGNGEGDQAASASVSATHESSSTTQMYHSQACDKGWSLFDKWCYKHIWEKRNWPEAETLCREAYGGHLVSVHSEMENNFVYEITYGLSSWIGYTDLDQDTHYQWSDSTQDDFSNLAKNCTGREHEPDCTRENVGQQWYNSKGHEERTFVCKKAARLPTGLLRNVSSMELAGGAWRTRSVCTAASSQPQPSTEAPLSSTPELKAAGSLATQPTAPSAEVNNGISEIRPKLTTATGLMSKIR